MSRYKKYTKINKKDYLNLNKPDFHKPSKMYYKKRKSDLNQIKENVHNLNHKPKIKCSNCKKLFIQIKVNHKYCQDCYYSLFPSKYYSKLKTSNFRQRYKAPNFHGGCTTKRKFKYDVS